MVWYSGAAAVFLYSAIVVFYLLRRRRRCYDIDEGTNRTSVENLTNGYLFFSQCILLISYIF